VAWEIYDGTLISNIVSERSYEQLPTRVRHSNSFLEDYIKYLIPFPKLRKVTFKLPYFFHPHPPLPLDAWPELDNMIATWNTILDATGKFSGRVVQTCNGEGTVRGQSFGEWTWEANNGETLGRVSLNNQSGVEIPVGVPGFMPHANRFWNSYHYAGSDAWPSWRPRQ